MAPCGYAARRRRNHTGSERADAETHPVADQTKRSVRDTSGVSAAGIVTPVPACRGFSHRNRADQTGPSRLGTFHAAIFGVTDFEY